MVEKMNMQIRNQGTLISPLNITSDKSQLIQIYESNQVRENVRN